MPTRPPQFKPAFQPTRLERNREFDSRRRNEAPWRNWYKLARWQAIREYQLTMQPLCAICLEDEIVTPATVCDHVIPHRGDPDLFWAGPFQSLCSPCHNSTKQREEQRK